MTWESWVAMGDIHKSSLSLLEASQGIWGVRGAHCSYFFSYFLPGGRIRDCFPHYSGPCLARCSVLQWESPPRLSQQKASLPHFLGPGTLSGQ